LEIAGKLEKMPQDNIGKTPLLSRPPAVTKSQKLPRKTAFWPDIAKIGVLNREFNGKSRPGRGKLQIAVKK
jgi:hypothetical protein